MNDIRKLCNQMKQSLKLKRNIFFSLLKMFCYDSCFRVKAPALESAAVSSTAAATNSGARPDVISTEYRKISVESWSEQQVQDFIFDKKLDIMSLLTENMDGEEFYDLWYRCQKQQDCWAMFDRLDRELEKRHSKTLPISTYVRFLHQVPKYCNTSSLF